MSGAIIAALTVAVAVAVLRVLLLPQGRRRSVASRLAAGRSVLVWMDAALLVGMFAAFRPQLWLALVIWLPLNALLFAVLVVHYRATQSPTAAGVRDMTTLNADRTVVTVLFAVFCAGIATALIAGGTPWWGDVVPMLTAIATWLWLGRAIAKHPDGHGDGGITNSDPAR